MLLGFVVLVWGSIGFKLLNVFSPDTGTAVVVEKTIQFTPKNPAPKDTFSILAAYRDPFLGTVSTLPKKKQPPQKPKPKPVVFPTIRYTGSIANPYTKSPVFFVTIAGNAYLMKKGDKNDGITLVRGTDTTLSIRYKGTLKTIPLQYAAP